MTQKIGKYTIIEKLGEGSMGAVYKAYDAVLDRYVAIKIMADEIKWDPELKLRFYREARSAANIHHPNIVTIHDLGEEGKITYIVLELLEGTDLKAIIANKTPLPLEEKLSIIAQVADGLNHAHRLGIIHRDIKPGNIHISPTGIAKILDFGIAHIPMSDLTRTGSRLGTPVYMSPEQIRGEESDAKSDIFSLGIVFYEFVTYVHPFRDKKIDKTLDNILFQTQLPFDVQFPDAPPKLLPIIARCLAKDPQQRCASMGDLIHSCRELIAELTIARQAMAKEIEASLPHLQAKSKSMSDSPRLLELIKEVQNTLGDKGKADYLSVLSLSKSVAQESPLAVGIASGAIATPSVTIRPEVVTQAPRNPSPEPDVESEARSRAWLQNAEQLLKEDRLGEAIEELRKAIGALGPRRDLVEMLSDTRRKLEERKRTRVSQLLGLARGAFDDNKSAQAVEILNEVFELVPEHPEAVELRRQALTALDSEKARQARQEEGEREKVKGFRLLADKHFRESLLTLKHAAELLGEDSAVKLGIEEAEEGIRIEELFIRIQSEMTEAQQAFRSQKYDIARSRANRILEISPKNSDAVALLARIEKAIEEKRRAEAMASLVSRGEQTLAGGDLSTASALANEALMADPANPQAIRLNERIGQAKEEARRREESALLLKKAAESLEAKDFDAAANFANNALQVIPQMPEALQCLKEIQQAREDYRRSQEVGKIISEAETAFAGGHLEQCEASTRKALEADPGNLRAKELLTRIQQELAKRKASRVQALIDSARAELAKGDFLKAETCARDILLVDAQSKAAAGLMSEIAQARAKRREEEVAARMAQGRAALERGDLDKAEELVRTVLDQEPKHSEAKALMKTIGKTRRTQGKDKGTEPESYEREADNGPRAIDPDATERLGQGFRDKPVGSGMPWKLLGWIGAAVVVLGVAFGAFYLKRHAAKPQLSAPVDVSAQLNLAKSHLDQKRYDEAIEAAQRLLATSPDNRAAQAIRSEAIKQKQQLAIEVIMLEAQNLRSQNQLDEANKAVQKILDIDPSNKPALAVRSEIEAEISAGKSKEEQDAQIRKWLAECRTLPRLRQAGRSQE